MSSAFSVLAAAADTMRRLGASRLYSRLSRKVRYRLLYPMFGERLYRERPGGGVQAAARVSAAQSKSAERGVRALPEELSRADDLRARRFAFLNLPPRDLGSPADWLHAPGGESLWIYTLHYGEWAECLARACRATGDSSYCEALVSLVGDWIDHNRRCSEPGWDPYPLSRRLVSWSRVFNDLRDDARWVSFAQERLLPSLRVQTRVLDANLERDIANNHLIANCKALAWMGLSFPELPEAREWRKDGLGGLWGEMRRQVLPDGVHDERSVSYHAIVLEDLLDVARLCITRGVAVPYDVQPTIRKMALFLETMRAPDGSYPMVNDTVPGYPDRIEETVSAALDFTETAPAGLRATGESRSGSKHGVFRDAGYAVLGSGGDRLYFDAGPMGPTHLPGHGHADTLGIVLYGNGHPLIVDPGVYSYHDRTWRDHFRSTRAHSTVEIDGVDQCVFWGNFRVAFPPEARLLEAAESAAIGEHEGYRRLPQPVTHRRWVGRTGPSSWELDDSFAGRGTHDFLLSFQLAPGAETTHDAGAVLVRWPGKARLNVVLPDLPPGATIDVEQGWVSPGWYQKLKAPRIAVRWRATVPGGLRARLESAPDQ